MGAKKAIEAAPKGNLNQVVASLGWRKFGLPHPVSVKAGKKSPTGIRRALWDGLAPVPAPFTLNGTHQDYTDCSTHRHD